MFQDFHNYLSLEDELILSVIFGSTLGVHISACICIGNWLAEWQNNELNLIVRRGWNSTRKVIRRFTAELKSAYLNALERCWPLSQTRAKSHGHNDLRCTWILERLSPAHSQNTSWPLQQLSPAGTRSHPCLKKQTKHWHKCPEEVKGWQQGILVFICVRLSI